MEITLPLNDLGALCRRYHVRELALFGSAVRGQVRLDSDLDFLVEFEPEARIGLIAFNGLADDLSALFHKPVDLVSKNGLKDGIRDQVLAEAEVVFAA